MTRRLLGAIAFAMVLVNSLTLINPLTADATSAHDDQITRLYITALGRTPDAEGHDYWSDRRVSGESLIELARVMIDTPEAQAVTSGDFVIDAYRNAFGRVPEPDGHAYWLSYNDPAQAVAYIADSQELQALTSTQAPPVPELSVEGTTTAKSDHPEGWVDAGSGVYVPPILLSIRYCESKDSYVAANSRSSARGAYQFLTSSWAAYGHADRYGVSSADQATPAQQDEAAVVTWRQSGTRPWNASRHCWG